MAIPRFPRRYFSLAAVSATGSQVPAMVREWPRNSAITTIARSDADVVDAGPSVARDFARGRNQNVAEFAGPDESDVALCRDGALVVRVAGKGERRVREQEDEAAMGNALAVDHVRLDRHRHRRLAGLDLDDLHAETLAGVVFLPHRIRAGACEVLGRKRGLDVHFGLPVVGLVEQASWSQRKSCGATPGVSTRP